ncbi:hypothetical protein [Kitasatospora sp. NPDC005856]|uniref:hypothetical protein n=1 Tax=Kitasatospora sp. NPDC005856 TaxID=3154566 RepID=UPI0033F462F2
MTVQVAVSTQSRRAVRAKCSSSLTVAEIEGCWESEGFVQAHVVQAGSAVRSRTFDAYDAAVDWSDPAAAAKGLRAFERMLRMIQNSADERGLPSGLTDVIKAFGEDGYQVNGKMQILRFGDDRPEHATSAAESYEMALRILRNARTQLERSPRLTAGLGEELTRDILLVALNGYFEGRTTGETTNHRGKTDILVRVADLNVLIAECKIWSGQQSVAGALTQVLGYLSWADTHAALLVFIRSGKPAEVMAKVIHAIESHPNWSRTVRADTRNRQVEFVVRAKQDAAREVSLALIPFVFTDS